MTESLSIVWGLGIIALMFAYYAFNFKDSEQEVNQKIAIFLFFVSLMFTNLLMYSLLVVAQNTGQTWFLDSVLYTGLQVIMWVTLGIIIIYFVYSLMMLLWWLYLKMVDSVKGKLKEEKL